MSKPRDKLYITDLPQSIDEDGLRTAFAQYGNVKHCHLASEKGSAIVRYETIDEAKWVVENLNGHIPQGFENPVQVKYAEGSKDGKGGNPWKIDGFDLWRNPYAGLGALIMAGKLGAKGLGKSFSMKGKCKGKGKGGLFSGTKDAKSLVRICLESAPGGRKWENDENTLFVGGLPEDMTDLDMYTIFAPFGAIAPRGASARRDKDTGKCTGIGFVNYLDHASSQLAMRTLHGTLMPDGSILTVKKKGQAKPKGEGKGAGKGASKGKVPASAVPESETPAAAIVPAKVAEPQEQTL